MRRLRPQEDGGFTLLEVITTCLLLGVLTSLAVGPWRGYEQTRAHRAAAQELVSLLRHAQVSSVSEVVTYRVDISPSAAKEYRVPVSGVPQLMQTTKISNSVVAYSGASFTDASGVVGTSVFFYPKGSASAGNVQVVRSDRSKVYTVYVEGLTARVWYTG